QGFRLRVGDDWIEARHLVLACEAYQAAELAGAFDPELAALLRSIPYSSSMTVALGFNRSELGRSLDGFGFLVPKRERRRLVACTWVGTKFSHRTPDSIVLLRCFLGGAGGESTLKEADEQVVAGVASDLGEILGISVRPLFTRIFRWPRSMAQYHIGHASR